jgi:amino acid transporter
MKKHLTAWSLLWISLTSMIGSGWLFGALYSAHFAGPAAIIAWPLAGFLLLFVALSYAEVATLFSEENSLARLPYYTHGRLTSMIMSGLAWISLATIPAIETQGLVQYSSNYLPFLMQKHSLHYAPTLIGYLTESVILLSFILFNYFGVRLFSRINTSFTIWKLFIPFFTIIFLIKTSYHAKNFSHYEGFMPYGWHGVMAAMSSGGVLFSLLGFRQVVIMMSEIENPGKYVPLVLVTSLLSATLLYTGLQWSFIGSLRAEDLSAGWKNLAFTGDAGPFAALASIAGIVWLSKLLYTDAIISPYSTGLVYSTTAAKMLAGMSSMGDVSKTLAKVNTHESPWISLWVNFFLAAAMLFFLRSWQDMAAFLVAIMTVTYTVGPISLMCFRSQLPNHPRPFYLYGGRWIALLGFYICTAGAYWSGLNSIKKLLFLTCIYVGYLLVYYKIFKRSTKKLEGKNTIWIFCYLLGLGVFSYFGNYGGNHTIPADWDLLYLFIFSTTIFLLAFFTKKTSPPTAHSTANILGMSSERS